LEEVAGRGVAVLLHPEMRSAGDVQIGMGTHDGRGSFTAGSAGSDREPNVHIDCDGRPLTQWRPRPQRRSTSIVSNSSA
jgi:hypothetical protein